MSKETCYIGVVGGEWEHGPCRDSIHNLTIRPGDSIRYVRGTKGYESRQTHFNIFMAGTHDYMLLLDHDMIFPEDTLERLRSHQLPYVSGFYMRRRYAPIVPVWFHPWEGAWPFRPYLEIPESGRLHEIGASGWGCILIHRQVIEDTRKILKGEPDVIEDDMDVWPYDLAAVLRGEEQLRPLRGQKDPVGSDIRYPFYAVHAGYQLVGDPDVSCGHIIHYPLAITDYPGVTPERFAEVLEQERQAFAGLRQAWQEQIEALEQANGRVLA